MTIPRASASSTLSAAHGARGEPARLHGRPLLLARAGWLTVTGITLALFVVSLPLLYDQITRFEFPQGFGFDPEDVEAVRVGLDRLGLSTEFYAAYFTVIIALFAAVFVAVAAVIFLRRSDEPMPLVCSLILVLCGVAVPGAMHALEAVHPAWDAVAEVLVFLGLYPFLALFYVFPDGRFVPHWTRPLAPAFLTLAVLAEFFPGLPISPDSWPPLLSFGVLFFFLGTLVFAQVYRYRRVSGPIERQQTKWVVLGLITAIVVSAATPIIREVYPALRQPGAPAAVYDLASTSLQLLALLLVPLAIGMAVLRYRLYDIDLLINRALLYTALTLSVGAIYGLVVGSLGLLLQAQGSPAVAALAIGVAAVLFQPLRGRLQRAVNRLTYGERDEPYTVLSRLGRRLDATLVPGAALMAIVETAATALKLPYAAVLLRQVDGLTAAAAYGTPVPAALTLPLRHQGETVGELVLAARAPGEAFTGRDRQLLEDLARHAGAAAHAARLTADLQRSRERLVAAREEERRRLRRDLHDGHLPTLAGLALQLDASRVLVTRDPPRAVKLLTKLGEELREASANVRGLVYDLRPPALDQFGLVGALRNHAARYTGAGVGAQDEGSLTPLDITIETAEPLPPLPAAVEVAAYRIAVEALTNVGRHAHARSCHIRLWLSEGDGALSPHSPGALHVEVTDDGMGLPPERRSGVGLNSMHERAEELGGTCVIESAPEGGTRVRARLPLPAGAAGPGAN
jgi:signal transduction histidine kinase